MRNNNNRKQHNRNRSRGKFRSGGQSLAQQKKNALAQKEKYLNMARDAQDRVDAEYYYQHVEHYSRLVGEIMEKEDNTARESKGAEQEASPDADVQEEVAEDTQVSEEEKPKARARKKPTAKKSEEDIPLPASVLPEADGNAAANAG